MEEFFDKGEIVIVVVLDTGYNGSVKGAVGVQGDRKIKVKAEVGIEIVGKGEVTVVGDIEVSGKRKIEVEVEVAGKVAGKVEVEVAEDSGARISKIVPEVDESQQEK